MTQPSTIKKVSITHQQCTLIDLETEIYRNRKCINIIHMEVYVLTEEKLLRDSVEGSKFC